MKTVVGVYSTLTDAEKVKSALLTEGYEAAQIKVVDQDKQTATSSGSSNAAGATESLTQKIKGFFTNFTDHDNEDVHQQYASSINNGGALLSVTVPDNEAEDAADLLYQHGAVSIEGDSVASSGYQGEALQGNTQGVAATTSGEQVIPIVQEELVVGKRQVERGGVRIYSHLVEEPVTTGVRLHDERIVVERHAVDRAATEADFANGPGVVELTATGEEAVVGKTSRVVEEVSVGKQATERVEQVNDTVRHTEVEVERLAGSTAVKP